MAGWAELTEAERAEVLARWKHSATRGAGVVNAALAVSVVDALRLLEEQKRTLEEALSRALYIAEHLFQMVPREVWRAQGAEAEGMYEGDYWAEQTQAELVDLRSALASVHEELEKT